MNPISFKSNVFINTDNNTTLSPTRVKLLREQFKESTPNDDAKIVIQPLVTEDGLDKISYYNKGFSDDLYINFSQNINNNSVQTSVYQLNDIAKVFEARRGYDEMIQTNNDTINELKQHNNNIKKTKKMITEVLLRQNQTKGNEFWADF